MGRIVEMPLPRLGETMDEGRIGLIVKQPGQAFRRGEILLEVESDKTTVEVPALQDGILVEWLVQSDQMVPVDSAIARIEIEGDARPSPPAQAGGEGGSCKATDGWGPWLSEEGPHPSRALRRAPPSPASQARPEKDDILRPRASTAARAAARKAKVDLSVIAGTGRNGRISAADVAAALRPARATYHVETQHGKIFVREWPAIGQARGIALLIHGLFADAQSFTTLGRKCAAAGFRALAVDLPGHGETQSTATTIEDIVAAVAAALPPARLHIVGHSFGAVVATGLADHAASLTLLSPAGCGEEINGGFVDAMLRGHIDRALGFLGETIPAEAVAGFAEHLDVHGSHLRGIAGNVVEGAKQTISILSRLSALAIPVNAVFLRDDQVIPARHALNLPANVAVRFLKGTSHLPHWRDPDLIVRLLG